MPAAISVLLLAIIGGGVIAAGLMIVVTNVTGMRHWRGWVGVLAGLLIVFGACGFFGSGLSACGGLDWLGSFEWPIGHTSGVVRATNGMYVVPHQPSGRVQIYDEQRRFIRGWRINAGGGMFVVRALPNGNIDIHTARGERHLVYDVQGKLLSEETYDVRAMPRQLDEPTESFSMTIPTAWILWPLTGPAYAWLCFITGLLLSARLDRGGQRSKPKALALSQLPVDV